ncbi:MAG: hypothetical protein QOI55_1344 [Actinomycetota bacterium]|nr:hypothetical protein [Actinomycetota bacterium]
MATVVNRKRFRGNVPTSRWVAYGAAVAREPYVQEVELALAPATDSAAPGGAVTVELCGHWEYSGACRWPHNNTIDTTVEPARFRTLFVASPADEPEVRARIERALRREPTWTVVRSASRTLHDSEHALAQRLAQVGE